MIKKNVFEHKYTKSESIYFEILGKSGKLCLKMSNQNTFCHLKFPNIWKFVIAGAALGTKKGRSCHAAAVSGVAAWPRRCCTCLPCCNSCADKLAWRRGWGDVGLSKRKKEERERRTWLVWTWWFVASSSEKRKKKIVLKRPSLVSFKHSAFFCRLEDIGNRF